MSAAVKSIREVAEVVMGTSPKGHTYNDADEGLPLLNGPTEFGESHPECSVYTTASVKECEPGDLIFCVRGSTTGRMNWADRVYSLGRGVCAIRGETELDTKFIRYCLDYRLPALLQLAGGATFPNLPQDTIKAFKIPFPSNRKAIASVLSAYDDLIENNRRRMALLEEAARQLYREWFVRLRFPGHEHTRITNGVPDGWEKRRIGDVAECVGGGTPSTSVSNYWEDGDITWVTPTDVTRNAHFVLLDSEKKITEAGLQSSSAKLVPAHAVLMTSRASVGFFAVAGREVCTNQGFISVVLHDSVLWPYLLFHLSERVEEIRVMGSGSTYPEVSRGKFRELEVLLPKHTLATAFCEQATALLNQIRILKLQNEKLRAARDLLLPRLMSGEITV